MVDPHDPAEDDRAYPRLAGRDREIRVLEEALASIRGGRGRLVLVGGEIGIGKTALVRQFLDAHAGDGLTALIGRAYDLAATPPFALWRDLLRSPDARPIVPPDWDWMLAGEQGNPLDRFAEWLAGVTRDGPVAIRLEDIHWADAESLELLRQLAWRIGNLPVLILATYRDVDIGRDNPLYQQLPALLRESDAIHITLHRLDRAATQTLVAEGRRLLPLDLERLTEYVYTASQGNPLVCHEVIRTLRAENVLEPGDHDEACWRLGALDRLVVPPLVRQIIDGRVAQLGNDGRGVLEIAAVLGEEIPASRLELWRDLAGVDEASFRQTIDRAIEQYLLVEVDRPGLLRFHHTLVRESLYDGVGLVRRQDLHRRIGKALADSGHPDVEEVAVHLYLARDPAGVDWLVRAAEQAQQVGGWVTAATRFEEAVEISRYTPGSGRTVGWLLYRAALMRRFSDVRRSLELLDEASAVARSTDDAALVVGTRYHRGFVLCWAHQVQAGIAAMEAAAAEMERLSDEDYAHLQVVESFGSRGRGEHRGTVIAWNSMIGRYREALDQSASLDVGAAPVVAGRQGLSRSAVGDGYTGRAVGLAMLGQPERTPQLFEAARQSYASISHSHQLGWSYLDELLHVVLPYHADDIGRREWLVREAASAWERSGRSGGAPPAAIAGLPLHLIEGNWQAVRATAERIDRADRIGWFVAPALATIAVHSDDRQMFSRAIADMLPAGPDTRPGTTVYTAGFQLLYLSALRCVLWGEPEAAPPWLDAMERWLDWSGAVPGRAELAVARAVHAFATARLADIDRYARDAVRLASSPRQPLVLAMARRLLARSLVHAGLTDEARAELDRSIAVAQACRNRLDEATGMMMLSELQSRDGQTEQARATLDAAVDIFTEMGATSWSSFVARVRDWWGMAESGTQPRRLSPRETEVLRLVANGLTDAEVAKQLHLSRRTVTTHLSSIYEKLGVSSRAAATRIGVERHLI